jgi:ethanolamine ammonia-lyase large subunit
MTQYRATLGNRTYAFDSLGTLLAKASHARSGDALAGIAAESEAERVAAQMALADVPLQKFLEQPLTPIDSRRQST